MIYEIKYEKNKDMYENMFFLDEEEEDGDSMLTVNLPHAAIKGVKR